MIELIDRIEAATGADRDLNAAIAVASGQYVVSRHHPGMFAHKDRPHQFSYFVPAYTASIDAAMGLVPDGWAWMVGCAPDFQRFFATLMTTDDAAPIEDETIDTNAATPALALCAAAMKARESDNAPAQV